MRRINLGQKFFKTTKQSCRDKNTLLKRLEQYLTFEKRYSKTNIKCQLQNASYLLDRYDLTVIDRDKVREIEEDLMKKGIKSSTIIRKLETLEHLATCLGFTDNGMPLKIRRPKLVKTERKNLSLLEAKGLLEASSNTRDKAIIALLLYTGLRSKELLNLNIDDLDMKNRLVMVRASGGDIVKNYAERKVVLSKKCASILEEWLCIRPNVEGNDALFLNIYGKRLTRSGLYKIVLNTGKRAGIERNVYTHLLRHTCATSMLRAGIPVTEVALQLGHKSLSSTMVYLHGDLAGLREDIDKKLIY